MANCRFVVALTAARPGPCMVIDLPSDGWRRISLREMDGDGLGGHGGKQHRREGTTVLLAPHSQVPERPIEFGGCGAIHQSAHPVLQRRRLALRERDALPGSSASASDASASVQRGHRASERQARRSDEGHGLQRVRRVVDRLRRVPLHVPVE